MSLKLGTFVLILIFTFPACGFSWDWKDSEPKHHAKAWDSRPEEVVRAEGLVLGIEKYPYEYMLCVLAASSEALLSPEPALASNIEEFKVRLGDLQKHIERIKKHPEFGKAITMQSGHISALLALVALANEPMFKLNAILASHHHTFSCERKETSEP